MIVYVVVAVALVVIGAVIGVLWVITLGIRHEEASYSMMGVAPDRLSRAARVLNGLHVRTPVPQQESRYWEDSRL